MTTTTDSASSETVRCFPGMGRMPWNPRAGFISQLLASSISSSGRGGVCANSATVCSPASADAFEGARVVERQDHQQRHHAHRDQDNRNNFILGIHGLCKRHLSQMHFGLKVDACRIVSNGLTTGCWGWPVEVDFGGLFSARLLDPVVSQRRGPWFLPVLAL